jgi:hypothetical protein
MKATRFLLCVSEGGREGRAGSPLPDAARAECAHYHQSLTHYRFLLTIIACGAFSLGLGYADEASKPASDRGSNENHAAGVSPAEPAHGKPAPGKTEPTDEKPSNPKDDSHAPVKPKEESDAPAENRPAGPANPHTKSALVNKLPQPGKERGWWEQAPKSAPANKLPQSALKTAAHSAKAGLTTGGPIGNKTGNTPAQPGKPPVGTATPAPFGVRGRGVTAALLGASLGLGPKNAAAAGNSAKSTASAVIAANAKLKP